MALILEDGTVVANAQSFVEAVDLAAYAALRGISFPALEADQEQLLIKGMDYLLNREGEFKGSRVSAAQTLPFPRSGVYIFDFPLDSTTVPEQAKNAQIEAALFENTDSLLKNITNKNIQSSAVGSLRESYFNGGSWEVVRADRVNAQLTQLIENSSGITLVRI